MIFRQCQPANIDAQQQHESQKPRAHHQTTNADKLFMVIAVGHRITGLDLFGRHVARMSQAVDSDNHAGSARVIRVSVVNLWLPGRFIELAERQKMQPPIRTHKELRRVLEVEGQRDAWYALTVRQHHEMGGFDDLTYIRWPYSDPQNLWEYPEVLAVAAGKPPGDPVIDFSSVSVCVVPDQSPGRTPREVICEASARAYNGRYGSVATTDGCGSIASMHSPTERTEIKPNPCSTPPVSAPIAARRTAKMARQVEQFRADHRFITRRRPHFAATFFRCV